MNSPMVIGISRAAANAARPSMSVVAEDLRRRCSSTDREYGHLHCFISRIPSDAIEQQWHRVAGSLADGLGHFNIQPDTDGIARQPGSPTALPMMFHAQILGKSVLGLPALTSQWSPAQRRLPRNVQGSRGVICCSGTLALLLSSGLQVRLHQVENRFECLFRGVIERILRWPQRISLEYAAKVQDVLHSFRVCADFIDQD